MHITKKLTKVLLAIFLGAITIPLLSPIHVLGAPTVPILSYTTDCTNVTSPSITLNWTAPTGASTYNLRKIYPHGYTQTANVNTKVLTNTSESYEISDWTVSATQVGGIGAGTSAESNVVTIIGCGYGQYGVKNLRVTGGLNQKVLVEWDNLQICQSYGVWGKFPSNSWSEYYQGAYQKTGVVIAIPDSEWNALGQLQFRINCESSVYSGSASGVFSQTVQTQPNHTNFVYHIWDDGSITTGSDLNQTALLIMLVIVVISTRAFRWRGIE